MYYNQTFCMFTILYSTYMTHEYYKHNKQIYEINTTNNKYRVLDTETASQDISSSPYEVTDATFGEWTQSNSIQIKRIQLNGTKLFPQAESNKLKLYVS